MNPLSRTGTADTSAGLDEPDQLTPPADATELFEWSTDEDGCFREFNGTNRDVAGFRIAIGGYQNADGSCHRWLELHGAPNITLSGPEARAVAAAFESAADEIEALTGE